MKLTMLGTGNAMVMGCYNTCFVIEDNRECFLVDAGGGNGILRQLKQAGINAADLKHIFITHGHTDHLLGVFWVIRQVARYGEKQGEEFYIYSHQDVIDVIRDVAEKFVLQKPVEQAGWLHLVTLEDGEEFEAIGHRFRAFDVHSSRARQFGFTMYYGDGAKLTCCGDEPYRDCEYEYAVGSDWLLHEAFCLYSDADRFHPYEKNHSTAKDACQAAQQLGVKNLVLYHLEETNLADRKQLYTEEGSRYFSGNLFVPDDFDVVELT